MTDREMETLLEAHCYIGKLFEGEGSGHGTDHMERVTRTAVAIAEREGADIFTVALASLLHDADDVKLFPDTAESHLHAVSFMEGEGLPASFIDEIVTIIDEVSFRGADTVAPSTLEGMCVQDADRLDAIGAIGVARAFSYGGKMGRKMYDPEERPREDMDEEEYRKSGSNTVNHFHEKLFLLKDMMNTESAKRMAEERDRFMHSFLDEFIAEWEGRR